MKKLNNKEKQQITINLTLPNVEKKTVKKIVTQKSLTRPNGYYLPIKSMSLEDIALVYNFFDYDSKSVFSYFSTTRKQTLNTFSKWLRPIEKILSEIIDFESAKATRTSNRAELGKVKSKVTKSKTLEKATEFFKVFGVSKKETEKTLENLSSMREVFEDEDLYLSLLYAMRNKFALKALGELHEVTVEGYYEVEETQDGELYTKGVKIGKDGKKTVLIRKKNIEPHNGSVVTMNLINAFIQDQKSNTNVIASEDELSLLYDSYIERIKNEQKMIEKIDEKLNEN